MAVAQNENIETIDATIFQMMAADPAYSAYVAANAGTGKTQVLTNRVLRLMLSGVHPSKILCLTYTKAAAAEMQERISKSLEEWALASDTELQSSLFKLAKTEATAQEIKRARELFTITLESTPPPRIQTIHSFCQEILKRFPFEAGIAPYFEVVDDIASHELLEQARVIALEDDASKWLAANTSETRFNEIIKEIIQQRNRIRDLFEANGGASGAIEKLIKPEATEEFFTAERLEFIKKLRKILAETTQKTMLKVLAKLSYEPPDFQIYKSIFLTGEEEIRKEPLTKQYKKQIEEELLREQEQVFLHNDSLQSLHTYNFTKHTYLLADKLFKVYEELKSARAIIDYNDLIYFTKKLLTQKSGAAWVLYKIDGGIDHILVDEAQDTSPEQWDIVLAILEEFYAGEGRTKRNRTAMIVGDEKQSIYSFQGAKSGALAEIAEDLRNKFKNWKNIPLNKSYRSTQAVLEFVDKIFSKPELREKITSDKLVSHEVHRINDAGKVEIWPLIKREEAEKFSKWQLPINFDNFKSEEAVLADKISEKIKSLIAAGRSESDIMILLQKRGEFADVIIKSLKAHGIGVSGADRLKLTEHIAIMDLIALAKFLLLPHDDYSLACALKSPLFGADENEIFELCHYRKGYLWEEVKKSRFYGELSDLLNKTDFMPVYEFFSHIIDVKNGRKKFLSRLGQDVNDVLDEFLQLTLDFEQNHSNSLQSFIHWLDSSDIEIKRDMEKSENAVRVMTVHASKGLQAPVVFIADAETKNQDKSIITWHGSEAFYTYTRKEAVGSLVSKLLEYKKAERDAEYIRLLYVALTRAKDELYICASEGSKAILKDCWYNIIIDVMGDETIIKNSGEFIVSKSVKTQSTPNEFPTFSEIADVKSERKTLNKSYDKVAIQEGIKIHKRLEHAESLKESDPEFKIVQKYPELFGANSSPEVPIIGFIDGEIISGKIDRVVIANDEVLIIDYKSGNRPNNKILNEYFQQLAKYKKLAGKIHPNKRLKTAILWTSENSLEYIDL